MAKIMQRHWNAEATEISHKRFDFDVRYAEDMGARVYDWSGKDRDGNPLQVTWVAGKRGGRVFSAYEITE